MPTPATRDILGKEHRYYRLGPASYSTWCQKLFEELDAFPLEWRAASFMSTAQEMRSPFAQQVIHHKKLLVSSTMRGQSDCNKLNIRNF